MCLPIPKFSMVFSMVKEMNVISNKRLRHFSIGLAVFDFIGLLLLFTIPITTYQKPSINFTEIREYFKNIQDSKAKIVSIPIKKLTKEESILVRDKLLVDINSADIEELMDLPGIGQVRANAIVLHRKGHGPFKKIEGLVEVKGIGKKTLDRLRNKVKVVKEGIN